MTRREKILALCVGGTLGGLALVTLVRWSVLSPFQSVRDQIAEEHRRSKNLRTTLQQVENVEEEWQTLTAQTLADDCQEAQRRFHEDMQHLLNLHGLREAKISPGGFKAYKDGSRGVPLTINGAGTLKEIVGFLCDFYCRDYLARLDRVRITADQAVLGDVNTNRPRAGGMRPGRTPPPSSRREPTFGPDGPALKVSISAITLVLPKLPGLKHPVAEKIIELPGGRLQRERAAYNAILDRNPFMPHQEKQVVVTPTTQSRQETATVTPATQPAVDPRAGAEQKLVKATTCLDGEPVAYVYDAQQRDQPPEKFYVDGQIDDGRLVLIHPRGLVVRVGVQDYFYPLGKSFRDREELSPDDHPDVWEALRHESLGSPNQPARERTAASG
jgi:hypothetical protein